MNVTSRTAVGLLCVIACGACGADKQRGSEEIDPVTDAPAKREDAGSATRDPEGVERDPAPPRERKDATVGRSDASPTAKRDAASADAEDATDAGDAGLSEADAGAPPQELPREFTNVDVTQNIKRRFGAPHVAVNPKDPNNIVVLASSNLGYTKECVPAPPGSDCEMIPAGGNFLLTQPRGFAKTPGFMDIGVFTSRDRGKTFTQINIDDLVPPGHPEVRARGEGPIAATLNGDFYIGFNAINWGNWESEPLTFFPNGGVGVIKSTDGGMTWKWMSYSFTPADWPYGGADPVTGTFYVTSGLAGISTLGPRSNGMPGSMEGTIADRWISSTDDGTTWTAPQPLGGMDGSRHIGASHSSVTAAHGIVATLFVIANQGSCDFFVGPGAPANCVVFQTSKDAGKTWERARVPTPSGFTAAGLSVFVAADPTKEGHFTAALMNQSGADFLVLRTPDAGKTWSEPVRVTEDASKTHFAPFVATSPRGEFGLMWRTYEPDPEDPWARAPNLPYSVWAAVSRDGGATFSRPLKVSKANSPAAPSDPNDAFRTIGDHGPSGMAIDGDGGVYVVWADWSPGERAIFFGAVDIEAFAP